MKYSFHWLQSHIAAALPAVPELEREITMRSFEIEGVEKFAGTNDMIFDIKVLPNRAHDALSHRGMAREISAVFGLPMNEKTPAPVTIDPAVPAVRVNVEDGELCPRYIGVRVDGIAIAPSSQALSEQLTSIGARSINNVVDLTNFILFDLGQPMHAFDAAKVKGAITVRCALKGEQMTTLDNKELLFDGSETVIADDEGVLALAGVKGGKKAEVDGETTSIIFECANFSATPTRRTSTKHNIKTDASKRYENGITSELAAEAIAHALALAASIFPNAKFGTITDVYPHREGERSEISVTLSEINELLGTNILPDDMEKVMERLGRIGFAFSEEEIADKYHKRYVISTPSERLDLDTKEDLIEEIGRIYGYDKIAPTLPRLPRKGAPHKRLYYANKVRNMLRGEGYSEVYTYSFAPKGEGEIEVLNPVGKDRPYMRSSLVPGIERALTLNFFNAPLLEITDVKIFEIGSVFSTKGEHASLAIGAMGGTKKRWKTLSGEFTKTALSLIESLGGAKSVIPASGDQSGVIEIDFDALIRSLPEPEENIALEGGRRDVVYKPFSMFPFIVRDIAVFVPADISEQSLEKLILDNAGPLAVRFSQFDKFQKPGEDRISYAYRLVFQSYERTLTDDETNAVMVSITAKLNANAGWEVR